MRRRWVMAGLLVLISGCGGKRPAPSFSGTWNVAKENGIAGRTEKTVLTILSAADKFRIETSGEDGVGVDLYDGATLTQTFTPLPDESGLVLDPTKTSQPKTTAQVEPFRFWNRTPDGEGTPGGKVAGRDTLLYQIREKRLDGDLTAQTWVDVETGIVLKKIFTVYSSQIEQMIQRNAEECTEIRFGPVDPAALARL